MDKAIEGPHYKRCPGVPCIGHSCNSKILTRIRCRNCERVYNSHKVYLESLRKPTFERWCLKCDRKFTAKNKFLRLCDGCRSGNRTAEHTGFDESMYSISFGGRG